MILGLDHDAAAAEACRLEHSLSQVAAERLHALMNYVESLPASERNRLRQAVESEVGGQSTFPHLVAIKTPGWRG